jgi:hypothetical protein
VSNSGPGPAGSPAEPAPPIRPIRVLAAIFDDGVWAVDLDVENEPTEDPDLVRLVLAAGDRSFLATADLPVEVLQRIARKIAEL